MKNSMDPVVIEIHGTAFAVDLERQVLRRITGPDTVISFIKNMVDHGDRYTFLYDTIAQKAVDEPYDECNVRLVSIPPMAELDPEGMAAKYNMTLSDLNGKTDFEIICDQPALEKRREGILPVIEIAGEEFVIDLRLQELRHAEYFFPVLSLKSFELTNDGWNYEAFYEPVMKQVVNLDPELTEFPNGIVRIKIPNEIGLDPVATAQSYGMDERALLRRYPIQKNLKAVIIPLSETEVPRLIRQNREQLRREHEENMQKAKPRMRPKL